MSKRLMLAAVVAALAAPIAVGSANAAGLTTDQFYYEVLSITPLCRDYPEAPVVGRVSGMIGRDPTRGVSFVGCFQNLAECEFWRLLVSGQVNDRIIQNNCQPRFG